jgi:murein DD-endopeptidase MepM/ murein hydrolase activator NlpD
MARTLLYVSAYPNDRDKQEASRMKKFLLSWIYIGVLFVGPLGLASNKSHDSLLEIKSETAANFFDTALEQEKLSLDSRPDVMPCAGRISSEFGMRALAHEHEKMHKGIDIAAPIGTPVLAPANGTVAFAGKMNGYGNVVIIKHNDQLSTLYGHNSKLFVKTGEVITKGEKISQVGNTGHSTGPHVHYEVRINDEPVNPVDYI